MSAGDVEAAALRARAAREQLADTAREIQRRLDPARLLDDAVTTAKDGAADLAIGAADVVNRRPHAAAAGAAFAVVLLARRPLWRLGRRIVRR